METEGIDSYEDGAYREKPFSGRQNGTLITLLFSLCQSLFLDKRLEVERQLSTRWSREELEDKYLRLYSENQELREYKVKQQEKIKMYNFYAVMADLA